MSGVGYPRTPLVPSSHALRVGTAGQTRRHGTGEGTESGTVRGNLHIRAAFCGFFAVHEPGRGPVQRRPHCPTAHTGLGTKRRFAREFPYPVLCPGLWRCLVGSKPCFRFAQTACPAGLKTAHGVRHGTT